MTISCQRNLSDTVQGFLVCPLPLRRKDPELEPRLQRALGENLTEIGQRCVQELQDLVDQMKD